MYPQGTVGYGKRLGDAVPKVSLTERFVANAKPLKASRTEYFDVVTPGLTLRVGETGHKSWGFSSPRPETESVLE
jgi:hypothetical protein